MSRYIDAEVMEQLVRDAMVNSPHMVPPLIKFIRGIPTADVAFGTPKEHFADVGKMVELLPTADVVEVVRCKDCKFFCREYRCYCGEFGGIVTEEDFCSRGERKTNKS